MSWAMAYLTPRPWPCFPLSVEHSLYLYLGNGLKSASVMGRKQPKSVKSALRLHKPHTHVEKLTGRPESTNSIAMQAALAASSTRGILEVEASVCVSMCVCLCLCSSNCVCVHDFAFLWKLHNVNVVSTRNTTTWVHKAARMCFLRCGGQSVFHRIVSRDDKGCLKKPHSSIRVLQQENISLSTLLKSANLLYWVSLQTFYVKTLKWKNSNIIRLNNEAVLGRE